MSNREKDATSIINTVTHQCIITTILYIKKATCANNDFLILILFVGLIGLTVAYFTNTANIENLFSSNPYGTTVTEEFISPDNWLPGSTEPKTLTVTNSGQVDEAVRVSYVETWTSANSNEEGDLPLEQNGNRVAIINWANTDDWTPVTENNKTYYYYNYKLAPGDVTSTLLDSVTFNSAITNESNCTTVTKNGTKTITCDSTGNGYDGATYKLTFTIETVQYDKYSVAWNTNTSIADSKQLFCDAFEVGESVIYNGVEYYVLKDSSTSDQYLTLLKKDPLTAEEVNTYSTSYVSENGEYPYYENDDCNANDESGCSTNYDTSDVKKIVDGWSSSFSDDLVSIDGYKAKLISGINDLVISRGNATSSMYFYIGDFYIEQAQYGIYLKDKDCWTMKTSDDSDDEVLASIYSVSANGGSHLENYKVYNKIYIRPVINLKKSTLDSVCHANKNTKYLVCFYGEKVKYNNEEYTIVENSDDTKKSVTVLKDQPLTTEEVNTYSTDYVSEDGKYPFCFDDSEQCDDDYINSDLKKLMDKWAENNEDLIKIHGYKATAERDYPNSYYWTYYYNYNTHELKYVKPVINLNKNAIEEGCHEEGKIYDVYWPGTTST